MKFIKSFLIITSIINLSACIMTEPKPDSIAYKPVMPEYKKDTSPVNGSLFHAHNGIDLYEDIKAMNVGDIITVVLAETTTAKVEQATDLKRTTSVDLENPTVLGSTPSFDTPPLIPLTSNKNNNLSMGIEGNSDFSGDGSSEQKNNLAGKIAVTVTQVLPNGNLFVKGEKWVNLNQGREYIRLSGIIRPKDIDAHNMIISEKIADARISYGGVGTIASHNRPGWLLKAITSAIWPF